MSVINAVHNCFFLFQQTPPKNWAIFSYGSKSSAFSDYGDSCSVIVDGLRCIGGLVTSASGSQRASVDIMYTILIIFLLMHMQENRLHKLNVNPTLKSQLLVEIMSKQI